jgi:drug/metabolite transporter (DMT)-like permease
MTTRRDSIWAHVLLLGVVTIWGSTFIVVKDALRDVSPLLFNQLRMILAFAILAGLHWRLWRTMHAPAIRAGLLCGICLAAGYEFQTAGLALTTPSKSAFITGLIVVIVPLLCAIPFLRPRGMGAPRPTAFAGALLAFGGIALLTLPFHTPASEVFAAINRGDLLSLGCALCFALHLLSLAYSTRFVSAREIATLQIGFCALTMTLLTPIVERTYLHWTPKLLMALALCALFGTAVAFSVQSWAQKHLKPTHTALLLSLEPAVAWSMSLALGREHFAGRSALGAGLIFSGILLTELLSSPVALDPEANQPAA